MHWRPIIDVANDSLQEFHSDKVPRLGAALAYYGIFSLAPLLIIAIGIASLIFGAQAARGEILEQVQGTIGSNAGRAVQDMLQAAQQNGGGWTATIIGVVMLFLGASGAFAQLQDSLNTIWHVKPKPGRSWCVTIRERFLSFGIVLGIGFLLLVSLILSAGLSAVSKFLTPASLQGGAYLWQAINTVVAFGFITVLLAMLFKVLPDVELGWRDVWVGALVTGALFSIGKYLLGLYLAHSGTASAFGAAGSLVVLLVWVYYSSQIVLFGAELTRTMMKRSGRQIKASDNAVLVDDQSPPLAEQPALKTIQSGR
jgi:membrane protein